jgi:hypothetical protein
MKLRLSNEQLALAWELSADIVSSRLNFESEPEEPTASIAAHARTVVVRHLRRQASAIRRRGRFGER